MAAAHCARCGEPFESKRKGHRFCSTACRVAASRDRKAGSSDAGASLSVIHGGGEGGSGRSRPVSTDVLIAPAVSEALEALETDPSDIGVARLARRYAATIDDARLIADRLDDVQMTEDNAQLLYVLRAKVQAQTVLDTLGPKLLAALESLGATPAARARLKGGGARGSSSGGKLASIRSGRPD